MADAAPLPIDLDQGRYLIKERLGDGAMADVFMAFDVQTDAWCAVKILKEEFLKRASVRERFTAEARILMMLDHRNIIRCLAANTEIEHPWMVLELAEGGCLIDWIQSNGKVPPRMAIDIAIQICKGLGAAHDAGIVHRDVKPHNILMNLPTVRCLRGWRSTSLFRSAKASGRLTTPASCTATSNPTTSS